MVKKIKIKPGDVFQIKLPNRKYAYGRIYKDASAGFYNKITDEPDCPPIGLRDFMFIIGFSSEAIINGLYGTKIVGNDPFENVDDAWLPPIKLLLGQIMYKGKVIDEIRDREKLKKLEYEWAGLNGIEEVAYRIMKTIGEPIEEIKLGSVIQIDLPNNKFAYGRMYRDRGLGIYKTITDEPGKPPIGERDFLFHIIWFKIYNIQIGICPIVGFDPFENEDESWPPPFRDHLGNIWHKGKETKATKKELVGLEEALSWQLDELINRIMKTITGEKVNIEIDDSFFNSDTAHDVKTEFDDLLVEGLSVEEISKRILESFKAPIEHGEKGEVLVALALCQLEQKKLQPEIKKQALECLKTGDGLEDWEGTADIDFEKKKKKIFKEVKNQLLQG